MAKRRLNLIIDESADATLDHFKARKDQTATETIHKALKLYRFVLDEMDKGGSLQLRDKDRALVRDIWIA